MNMQWTVTQNAYGWWDVTHGKHGFMQTFQEIEDAVKAIKIEQKKHQGYVAIVAGGNGAASGVCE